MDRLIPAHQILDRGSSAKYSNQAANQRANISMIDRRIKRPRRVPYLAIGSCNSPRHVVGGPALSQLTKEAISTFTPSRARPLAFLVSISTPLARGRCTERNIDALPTTCATATDRCHL